MEKKLELLEQELEEYKGAFTRHLEIYAENGKELATLSQVIKDHIKIEDARYEKMKPLLEGYTSIKWLFGIVIALAGLLVLLKELFQ